MSPQCSFMHLHFYLFHGRGLYLDPHLIHTNCLPHCWNFTFRTQEIGILLTHWEWIRFLFVILYVQWWCCFVSIFCESIKSLKDDILLRVFVHFVLHSNEHFAKGKLKRCLKYLLLSSSYYRVAQWNPFQV